MSKTIFITGASSGLGKITAKLFSEKGWTVIATMRTPENETELSQLPNLHILPLDISHPQQIVETVALAEKISPVDVLFNNAGYVLAGPLEAITDDQLEQQFNTNVFGAIRLTRAFLPYFTARKSGVILTTTALGAYIPDPFMALYVSSKAALESWSTGMFYELAAKHIYIKTIVPGLMQTNFVGNAQVKFHEAYQDDINKVLAAYADPAAAANADLPSTIAAAVYEAATDGKQQIHYFAGNDAVTRYQELSKKGLDVILQERKNFFLTNK
ncbi:Short-chain dehydrogenase [Chitinophaga costaii]|uniref:Short-chain dehydrogenase n=1 Tax=Chitinophaga costaii TaxID=1335309 RepID=A0A1C4EYJ7_9BACT|nr:SDR family oxidoreductase [Chitinophaga costaii]PUZ21554.1 SDR family NAD(P)-dependent oxidoreductase [Chitinophaga costaii]SCC48596.1 Short-chain dehydrogenase [Chitinophaga costaii]